MNALRIAIEASRAAGHYAADSLALAEAQRLVLGVIPSPAASEQVPLREALGRVLAAPLYSAIDVPAECSAAMDGWAMRHADLRTEGETTLRAVGASFAGHPFTGRLGRGECVRILTGAVVPEGADCIVMQEDARVEGDRVHLPPGQKAGQHCRPAGEDVARGLLALRAGEKLGPAQLGLAASLGADALIVRPRRRVAFFSTGDELVPLGQPLPRGGVYESNRHALWALITALGCEPVDLGSVRDDPAALEAVLRDAISRADAVITTGGAADGEADYTKRVAASLGEVAFWKLALRPGRPFAFGLLGEVPFFGLPGNPAAAMVAFLLLVRPALRRLMGCASLDLRTVRVRALEPMSKRLGREEYPRGTLERCADGETGVRFTPAQGTGSMLSLAQADVLVRLPADTAGIAVGDRVDVLLLEGVC